MHQQRCEGFGYALQESDSDSVSINFTFAFNAERAAQAVVGDVQIDDFVERNVGRMGFEIDIQEVGAVGQFVVGTVVVK